MNALCAHFGTCGGCAFQDLGDAEYRARKRALVVDALERHHLRAEVADTVEVPAASRRRCVFKIKKTGSAVAIGFHARASHDIVDMRECRVLTKPLAALVPRLRDIMGEVLSDGEACEAHATQAANGIDLMLRWRRRVTTATTGALARWAGRNGVVRITAGQEILVELEKPFVKIASARLQLPPGAFLQPTQAGEALLQAHVAKAVAGARQVADLFAGCGTFALSLAAKAKVHAVESEQTQLDALAQAVRGARGLKPVTTERRDLFKHPLSAAELGRFEAIVLDPPRAGASTQIAEIAASKVARVAYVSCNAQSFARDAATLVAAGWILRRVVPVDQFLWSEHIEIAADFVRN
ncbi:MAG: class I SAM-dependent RNA methyltransferase [Alphaproteobacteria bacterium]|nr:class I SAM-dependent RNA methyltransferase [Alphaproteobacteria bacterium]MBV9694448.1 class I SAM-dependent RNA methyltransferase [Alphaproteobacteria bacterium]